MADPTQTSPELWSTDDAAHDALHDASHDEPMFPIDIKLLTPHNVVYGLKDFNMVGFTSPYPDIMNMKHVFSCLVLFLASIKSTVMRRINGDVHNLLKSSLQNELIYVDTQLQTSSSQETDTFLENEILDAQIGLEPYSGAVDPATENRYETLVVEISGDDRIRKIDTERFDIPTLLMVYQRSTPYLIRSIQTSRYQVVVNDSCIKLSVHPDHLVRRSDNRLYLMKEFEFSWTKEYGCVVKFTHQLLTSNLKPSHIIRTRYHSNCSRGWFLAKNEAHDRDPTHNRPCHCLHKDMLLTYIRYTYVDLPDTDTSHKLDQFSTLSYDQSKLITSGSLDDLTTSVYEIENILSNIPGSTELAAKYMWTDDVDRCDVSTCTTVNNGRDEMYHITKRSSTLTEIFLKSPIKLTWDDYEPLISATVLTFVPGASGTIEFTKI